MKNTENIYDYLCDFYNKRTLKSNVDISLLGGDSGTILIQALLFEITSDETYKEIFEKNLIVSLQQITASVNCPVSFCGGLAGFGWLCLYLAENGFIEVDNNFYAEIDGTLFKAHKQMLIENNWDALYGAIGLSLYFLKRGLLNPVKDMIVYLNNTHHTYNEIEYVWLKTSFTKDTIGNYDLGLAHGNASIIYFLSKCYEKNISKSDCHLLIEGGLNFYMSHIQDHENVRSFFPNSIPYYACNDSISPEYSRMAWCYGDPGILYTLYMAARKLNLVERTHIFETMLEVTTYRRSDIDTSICDLGVCHGSSGLTIIYNELHFVTKNPIFKLASEYWRNVTMDFTKGKKKVFNFQEKSYLQFKIEDYHVDILDGLSGLALLFISDKIERKQGDKLNSWREMLLLN